MKTALSLAAVSLLVAALGACDRNRDVSYGAITGNLTPELKGLSERPTDDHSAFANASNQNLRMFWDDIGRTLYLDTPSRLHPYPVVNTSGHHR